ncbi:MAG: DUF2147 domain-containing protein [Chrysiogenales bacterium]|nr:MAG: DUF2147 domain-containing protein [Chrysiogenales bacterium]
MTILIVSVVLFGVPVKADNSALGLWKTIADEGKDKGKAKSYLEIIEKNGIYFAKITKLLIKPQDTLCDKCVGALKDKPLIGMAIMYNMKKTGKIDSTFGEEFAGGSIMDPDNGKTYKCKFWVKGDVMVVRGYLAFFYRTQRWYRVK